MEQQDKKIQLLVADDHHVLREGLISLLQTHADFEVGGSAGDGYEVLEQMKTRHFDVCLLDINMPNMDGMNVAKVIKAKYKEVKVIILTTYDEKEIIAEMIQTGVDGYLLKNSTRRELIDAIHQVVSGKKYFSDAVQETIIKGFAEIVMKSPEEAVILTEREKEILILLSKEYSNEKIAEILHISYRTVETHRKNMMQKTKAHNLAGLLNFAYSKGLLK